MFLIKARPLHGRLNFRGLQISIENAKHSSRAWKDPHNNTEGMTHMKHAYGYLRGTLGTDGDHLDVYLGPDRDAPMVYIVHQMSPPDFKVYDEDKCMLGFPSADAAKEAYLNQYDDPRFYGSMTEMPFEEFREKIFCCKGKMVKSHIQGYTRHTATGRSVYVREHDDKRQAHPDEPVREFGTIPEEVAKAAGVPTAPIRLVRGKQFSEHKGFGLEHIEVQHGEEIRQAGYDSGEAFVEDVVKNFNAVYDAGGGRLALVSDSGQGQKIHIVEVRYSRGQKFYTVVTAYIAERPKFNERRYRLLWKKLAKGLIGFLGLVKSRLFRKSGEAYCKQIGDKLGVDWKEVDLDEFANGMFVEEEHRDITHGDPEMTAKIVLAHLKEDPRYYTKLEKIEKAIKAGTFLLKRRE